MTLARTQPRAIARGPEWQLRFLQHEAGSTANLYSFVESARLELDDFIRSGSLTASDASFFRALQREVASFARKLNAEGARWVEEELPSAFDVGATTHAPHVVIPRGVLEALSRNSLGLIRQIGDDARREIRHHVASGILSGLSAQELRARIVSTGIGRGRWPSVEYRAGVIARTETMRAYNEGAIGGMTANGAAFARWIISPDEAVCPVCAPNAGVVFWLPGTRLPDGATDPYPAAKALPRIPRHPRCRCTVAAVYRDAEGRIIGAHVAPTEPQSPPQIADEPAVPPLSVGEAEDRYLDAKRSDVVEYPGRPDLDIPADPNYLGEGYGLKIGAAERASQMARLFEEGRWHYDETIPWELHALRGDLDKAMLSMRSVWLDAAYAPSSALIQSSLGDADAMVWSRGLALQEPSVASRKAADEMYRRTQAGLADGPATYTLYRGLKSDVTTRNVLESWSTEREFAERFDGFAVLKITVPKEAIFMDLREMTLFESELVVRGGMIDSATVEVLPGVAVENPVGG
jgi:hypothetical protein